MSSSPSVIVRMDAHRRVLQLDAETVELVWNSLCLRLAVRDFASLTNTAVQACLDAGPPPDSPARIFRLSLDTLVLEMQAEEFWQFSDLLRRATLRLIKRGTALQDGFDGWRIRVHRDPPHLASANPQSLTPVWMN